MTTANMRRRVSRKWLIGGAAIILIAAGWAYRAWSPPRWNVIILTLDTVRADHLGCYGYTHGQTPALDALAKKGVLFERACAPVPLTLPSHASMLTGCSPPVHGLHLNGRGRLGATVPVLTEILRDHHYETGAFVASYVLNSKFGLKRGFQRYDDEPAWTEQKDRTRHPRRDGAAVMSSAIDWMRGLRSRPFFCWIHLYDAHADPDSQYDAHEADFGETFRDRPYDAGIAYVDRQVERLRQFLSETKLSERTLLVVVGDHGEGLMEHGEREHGYLLYESTLRAPLLFTGPRLLQAGRRVPQLVSIVDLMPTVLDCLGIAFNKPICGQTLKPALLGEPISSRTCYASSDAPFEFSGWAPLRCVVTERWKYIETTWPELYDLDHDPRELHDLAAELPEQARELADLLGTLQAEMAQRAAAASGVTLSSREQRMLESLGYAGATRPPETTDIDGPLPDVKDMIPLYNELHIRLADAKRLLKETKPVEASVFLREILEKVPGYLEARLLLGQALIEQGEYAEATTVLERLLADQPDRAETYALLGRALVAQNQPAKAVPLYRQSLKLDSSVVQVHADFAKALLLIGRRAEAMAAYREILRRDPAHGEAKSGLDQLSNDSEK